ncbi:hypothetical protein [Streptomyces sp. NPDC056707]|uniref:hypothetical protein n=1 Tax=Streptomyces sp. NPDC056707 TaxID=3345919 RepID=UPI0036898448
MKAVATARMSGLKHLVAVLALVVLLVLPSGFTLTQFLSSTGDKLQSVKAEQAGVAYLRPLTKLVAALTAAQSAAVQGKKPAPGALRSAVVQVSEVDNMHGILLNTKQRWAALRRLVELTELKPPVGRAAYLSYSRNIDQALSMIAHVGETSQLITDDHVDTHYLGETAFRHLPRLLVDSGRLVDLVRLSDAPDAGGMQSTDRVLTSRDRVSASAIAVDNGLRRSMDTTSAALLGSDLIGYMDGVRDAVGELAPVTPLVDVEPVTDSDGKRLAAARNKVDSVLLELSSSTLRELDSLLRSDADRIEQDRTEVSIATLAAGAVAGWLLWVLLPQRLVSQQSAEQRPGAGRHRGSGAWSQESADDPMHDDLHELIDARDLLTNGQLVRMGRAVRPARRERISEAE